MNTELIDQIAAEEAEVWAEAAALRATIQGQLDALTAKAKDLHGMKAEAAVLYMQSLTIDSLTDPEVQRKLADLGWDSGRGLDGFDEAFRALLKTEPLYLQSYHMGWQSNYEDETSVINWTVAVPKRHEVDAAVLANTAKWVDLFYRAALAYAPWAQLDVSEHTCSENGSYFILPRGEGYVLMIRTYGRDSEVFAGESLLAVLDYMTDHCWRS